MNKLRLLIFCLFLASNAWGQETEKPVSEDEIKLGEALKKDKEFVEVNCTSKATAEQIQKGAKLRMEAFEAVKKTEKKIKLKKACVASDGETVTSFLTIVNGKAQIVIDNQLDYYLRKRVLSFQCSEINPGLLVVDEKTKRRSFQKIESDKLKDQPVVLQCVAGDDEVVF